MASADFPPAAVKEIVTEVANLLKERKETIAVAETAAGGIISASILSTPGASKIYLGGLTFLTGQLYTLESRIAFCGWTTETKANYKGPTPDVVAGMADHVRGTLGATYVISESGTAGPTGGSTRNRTPGYCAFAVSTERGTFKREVDTGCGTDRTANMVAFAVEALKLVRDVIKGDAKL